MTVGDELASRGIDCNGRGNLWLKMRNSVDPRVVWVEDRIHNSEMQDITEFYVEVSNLTSLPVRHHSIINVRDFFFLVFF